jgi:hypothetical protein
MQDWVSKNFVLILPFFFVALWILVGYWVALAGGWRLLAKRFRTQGPFSGQKWVMQSARMRWTTHYNNVLTVGANDSGLFIVPMILLRMWHPRLFVPWVEIGAGRKTQLFFLKVVELRLGRSEEIPFTVSATLAAKIEAAAGSSWPAPYHRAAQSPPPPIE